MAPDDRHDRARSLTPSAGPAESGARPAGRGFRSQPLALRILLIASLTALVVGVVRCSIELTSVRPRVESVGVQRALIDLEEGAAWAPVDTLAAWVARALADGLRRAGARDVRLASPGTSGFDAIARIRVSGSADEITVAVGIVDGSSGRALLEIGGEGAPAMLEAILNGAAVRVVHELGIPAADGSDGAGET
jgi:hypothetical protein